MKPGIYENISREEYDAIDDALNFSKLKYLSRSGLAYRHNCDNPCEQTLPMKLGNAGHLAILEPSMVDFAIWPAENGRRFGTVYDTWCAANEGRTMLNEKEVGYVIGMRDAVRANPLAMKYLRHARTEVTMVWYDRTFKRKFKARPDGIVDIDDEPVLVSLKSTVDCRDFKFASQYYKMAYYVQDAIYQNGYCELTKQLPRMITIPIESKPPHDCAVYEIPTIALRQGQQDLAKWIELLETCEQAHKWPGAVDGEQVLQLPDYAFTEGDFELDDMAAIEG